MKAPTGNAALLHSVLTRKSNILDSRQEFFTCPTRPEADYLAEILRRIPSISLEEVVHVRQLTLKRLERSETVFLKEGKTRASSL